MHISLDSALGRQRRLNQIGETISSIAAPTAAYSLRSLTGGDPRVVGVRRSSDDVDRDFTASQVSSGALLDFVGSGNNGFVHTWYDQSGNGNHAVQGADGEQPKIIDAGSSALIDAGSIDFGSSTSLSLASFNGGALSQPNTLFVVAQADNTDANQKIVAGATSTFVGTSTSATGRYNIRAGGSIRTGSTAVDSSQRLLSVFYNTTDELFINGSGTAEISADAGSSSLSSLFIGIQDNGFNGFDGKVKEVIVYNSDIGTTSATRTSLETNIKNHFGIS